MCVINDPFGQNHSPASSDNYSHLKFVLFRKILKRKNGREDIHTSRVKIMITTPAIIEGRPSGSRHQTEKMRSPGISECFLCPGVAINFRKRSSYAIDPRGRPAVTAGSDHYCHTGVYATVRPSPPFQISKNKTNLKWDMWTLLAVLWVWPSGSLMAHISLFLLASCFFSYPCETSWMLKDGSIFLKKL